MGRLVHIEITADDTSRARKFYSIFDWTFEDSNLAGVDYTLAHTGTGEPGLDAAIMPRRYNPQPAIHWVAVDDLTSMMEKVQQAGGSLAGEIHTVPGIGNTIYCKDSEGNTFGMLQPLPRA